MKIKCNCGNESTVYTIVEDEGQCVIFKPDTFRFGKTTDRVRFVCKKCDKEIL